MRSRGRRSGGKWTVVAAICGVLAAHGHVAAQNENETVGFKPNHVFDSGAFGENSDLLNGGLTLTTPIGPRYPVSRNFSYQLSLNYGSKIWDAAEWARTGGAFLMRRGPMGLGFSVGFGRIYKDVVLKANGNGTFNGYVWKWVSPDGAEHPLGESDLATIIPATSTYDSSFCTVQSSVSPAFWGSWDGSEATAPVFSVRCGDGLKYTFAHLVQVYADQGYNEPFNAARIISGTLTAQRRNYNRDFGGWYVTLIEDMKTPLVTIEEQGHPYDDQQIRSGHLYVTYETVPGFEHVISTIRDSVGRAIAFSNDCARSAGVCITSPADAEPAKPRLSVRTESITVPAFGGSEDLVPGETATYTFRYSYTTIENLEGAGTTTENRLDGMDYPSFETPIAGLAPDPYSLDFSYYANGELSYRELPTGARIGYLFESYVYVAPGMSGYGSAVATGYTRAVTQKTLDLDSLTPGFDGDWRYDRGNSSTLSNPYRVVVHLPEIRPRIKR